MVEGASVKLHVDPPEGVVLTWNGDPAGTGMLPSFANSFAANIRAFDSPVAALSSAVPTSNAPPSSVSQIPGNPSEPPSPAVNMYPYFCDHCACPTPSSDAKKISSAVAPSPSQEPVTRYPVVGSTAIEV